MPLTESQTRSPRERQDYEESLKNFRDWYSVIQTAENKGRAEGIAIGEERGIAIGEERGIAIGEERKDLNNISRMRAKGLDDTMIADLLNLDVDYVRKH